VGIGAELTMTGPPMDGGAGAGFPLPEWRRSAFHGARNLQQSPTGCLTAMAGAPCGLPFVAEAYDDGERAARRW